MRPLEARLPPPLKVGEQVRLAEPSEPPGPCGWQPDVTLYTVLRVTEGSAAVGRRTRRRDKMSYDWRTNSYNRVEGEERDEVMVIISRYAFVYREEKK